MNAPGIPNNDDDVGHDDDETKNRIYLSNEDYHNDNQGEKRDKSYTKLPSLNYF